MTLQKVTKEGTLYITNDGGFKFKPSKWLLYKWSMEQALKGVMFETPYMEIEEVR